MKLARCLLLGSAVSAIAAPAFAQSTAFRMSDLDLRDPHIYINYLGCRDVTDTPLVGYAVNGHTQTKIQTDGDGNGSLDLSYLIVFDPLDQAGAGGPIRFGTSTCTSPIATTTCGPPEGLASFTSTNSTMGQCLTPLAGTTRPYSPGIASPTAPCFASSEGTVTLELGGIPVTLTHARVAATYVGSPATNLVNGLLRGFISEADANATFIPASQPLIGNQPLSALLPGGTGNCAAHSDKDVVDGVIGWWFYLNFTAPMRPYTGPQVSVQDRDGSALALASTNPSQLPLRIEYRLDTEGPARISVHDLNGRRIAELASGRLSSGTHTLTWDGRLDGGGSVRPGLYVIRLATTGGTVTRQVVLLR